MKYAIIITGLIGLGSLILGFYVQKAGRSPDEAVGAVVPYIFGIIALILAAILAIIKAIR